MPTGTGTSTTLRNLDIQISDAYDVAMEAMLAAAPTWEEQLSFQETADQERVHFTFPYESIVIATGRQGDMTKFNNIKWQDVTFDLNKIHGGVEANVLEVNSPTFGPKIIKKASALPLHIKRQLQKMAATILNDGDTDAAYTTYDGQLFFANAHVVGLGNFAWDNLLAANPLNEAGLNAAFNALRTIPWGANGEPLPMEGAKFWLIVPPALQYTASMFMHNSNLPTATFNTENPFKGVAELLVVDLLDDVNDWYLAWTMGDMFPFVHMRHRTLATRALISDLAPDGEAAKQDKSTWKCQTYEGFYMANYIHVVKSTN